MSTFPNQDRRKKLTRDQVALAIRWVHAGFTRKAVAEKLGVSAEHISLVVRGYRREKVTVHG